MKKEINQSFATFQATVNYDILKLDCVTDGDSSV